MKVRKGDQVKILSGKDKNKVSEVVAVYPRTDKVLVKDVNIVTKFRKVNPNAETATRGIVKMEMPIHISNVMVINPDTGNPSRVGYEIDKSGNKKRVFKSNNKKTTKKSTKKTTADTKSKTTTKKKSTAKTNKKVKE